MTPSSGTPPLVQAEAEADLLGELRSRTGELHTRAERHPIQAALVRGSATRDDYASYLAQLLHIHAALEAELAARAAEPLLAPVEPAQFRAENAARDLEELGISGVEGPVSPVGSFRERVARADTLELLGMQYVLEGSTNGGRYIARAVGRGAGLAGAAATRYLDPYGEQQKDRWSAFCAAMSSLTLSADERGRVVAGAEAMFRLIIDTFEAMSARAAELSRPA